MSWKQIEATMEQTGSDDINGFSFRRALRKVGRGISRGTRGVARGVSRGARGVASLPKSAWKSVSSFIPGRDRGKATIVKRLNAKLIKEHANFLQIQDLQAGVRKPRVAYLQASKPWSRAQILRVGLPVKLAGSATASNILGDDVIGDWWNPLSWFSEKEEEATTNTQDERAPDEQVRQVQQQAPASEETPPEEAPPEESAGDWATFSNAFASSRKAGETAFMPESTDGDDLIVTGDGDIVRASELNGDFVGSDDLFGAAEERAIEASGDADAGRRFQRNKNLNTNSFARLFQGRNFGQIIKPRLQRDLRLRELNPRAHALKELIKTQLETSKVVSKALVMKWASAKAGSDTGERRRSLFRKMKAAINSRGGAISRDKREAAGI